MGYWHPKFEECCRPYLRQAGTIHIASHVAAAPTDHRPGIASINERV
jgi:hypothetical protein